MKKSGLLLVVILLFTLATVSAQVGIDNTEKQQENRVQQSEEVSSVAKENQCLSDSILSQKEEACRERGGVSSQINLPNGCVQIDCNFKKGDAKFFSARPDCPDVRAVQNECRDLGLRTILNKDRGCLYAKCASDSLNPEELCSEADPSFKKRLVAQCLERGGEPNTNFENSTGCPKTRCSLNEEDKKGACQREVPDTAYKRCDEEGGNLIVKFDELQCVNFQKCIKRGNEDNIEVTEEEVKNVQDLDLTDLLSIALKLEALATNLKDLEKKSAEIASYHSNDGNNAKEERFDRVATMFAAAEDRIETIKSLIADAAKDNKVSDDEVLAIKHDIKYIKEVVLNDILFVMLGEIDLVKNYESRDKPGTTKVDCKDDEECFNDRLKICGSALFNPEPEIDVIIEGIGKKGCKFSAQGKTPFGSRSMKCEYPNYAFGFERPQDFIPYCKGSMVKMLEEEIDREYEDDFKDEGPPPMCLENDIFDPKECFELTIDKYGLPPFCKGLSADECFEKELSPRINKEMPPECRERNLVGFECAKHMFATFGLPSQCEDASLNEKQCMRAIMSGEINPDEGGEFGDGEHFGPKECDGIPRNECETIMAKKHGAPKECFEDSKFIGRYDCEDKMRRNMPNHDGPRFNQYGGDPFKVCKEKGISDLNECEQLMKESGRLGGDYEHRYRETKNREKQCALTCEAQGKAWDFSNGCSCHDGDQYRSERNNDNNRQRNFEDRNQKNRNQDNYEQNRNDFERKKKEFTQNYENLFADPSISNSEKERLKKEMYEGLRQLEDKFSQRGNNEPNYQKECPSNGEKKRQCESDGGYWREESGGNCPYIICENKNRAQCPDINAMSPPNCGRNRAEIRTDNTGCQHFFCVEQSVEYEQDYEENNYNSEQYAYKQEYDEQYKQEYYEQQRGEYEPDNYDDKQNEPNHQDNVQTSEENYHEEHSTSDNDIDRSNSDKITGGAITGWIIKRW